MRRDSARALMEHHCSSGLWCCCDLPVTCCRYDEGATPDSAAIIRILPKSIFRRDPVVAGERIEYALTVTNTSSLPVTGVVVSNLMPQFVNVTESQIPDGGTCQEFCGTGDRIAWNIGTLAAAGTRTLSYQAVTGINIESGVNLCNKASVAYDLEFGSSDVDIGVGVVIDADEDGLNNFDEFQNNTGPTDKDTDNDGLSDGFDALDAAQDPDGDGFTNLEEFACQSNPRSAASFYITGGLRDDMIVDFGSICPWARMNDTSWQKLNNSSSEKVVIGDVDGNGQDDVIGKFGSTLGEIFVKRDQSPWLKLHDTSPDSLAVGNLDNN